MTTETGKQAGDPAGRFCPTCRTEMVYTGHQRGSRDTLASEQRCSTCGFTAWKRSLFGAGAPTKDTPS